MGHFNVVGPCAAAVVVLAAAIGHAAAAAALGEGEDAVSAVVAVAHALGADIAGAGFN